MSVSPRVLLSIDYEPVFALFRRYDFIRDSRQRCDLDGGFTHRALEPILEQLGDSKASLFLVGEIAEWYPDVPQRIISAGHELGLHCHIHRPLVNVNEPDVDVCEPDGPDVIVVSGVAVSTWTVRPSETADSLPAVSVARAD